ncbi:MAG: thioredoxin [Gammaproteobacteria bacterium]|nr:MAG: thioredoxin [Gammaproteobacteria bacterium]
MFLLVLLLPFCLTAPWAIAQENKEQQIIWAEQGDGDELKVRLYFFWSPTCPHCDRARPVIEQMQKNIPWLQLYSLSIAKPENRHLYQQMAEALGQEARSVPAFLFCGYMTTGFHEEMTPVYLQSSLSDCREQLLKAPDESPEMAADEMVHIPLFGPVDSQSLSLPVLTLILAGLDSFNPCAFFVLLFLLSLLVHAGGRKRMLIIGGVFIGISGLVYFLFMAAWLNLFMLVGDSRWITAIAGVVAAGLAVINIKDFFLPDRGVSLSIPDEAKPGLFKRMRGLLNADNMPAMLIGTVVLAVVANSYELLCTAGFPMVYSRTLTLHELSTASYYLYLVLYNVVYVTPLMMILGIFVFTLGTRKLQEKEGRVLKLLSGLMMMGLGLILLLHPSALDNVLTAAGLLLLSLLVAGLFYRYYPYDKRA